MNYQLILLVLVISNPDHLVLKFLGHEAGPLHLVLLL